MKPSLGQAPKGLRSVEGSGAGDGWSAALDAEGRPVVTLLRDGVRTSFRMPE
ncbi:hypothetical protein [Paenibacillus sp. PL2-23]|uniref:hypothetical protein n=1 Tax=Paenibacillus sp. PL2-23 TaxID=2100729 RepID=UPI0030F6F073